MVARYTRSRSKVSGTRKRTTARTTKTASTRRRKTARSRATAAKKAYEELSVFKKLLTAEGWRRLMMGRKMTSSSSSKRRHSQRNWY